MTWLAGSAIGAYLTPSSHGHGTHTQLLLPPCPSVMLANRPCPGCGMTTSFTWLMHGNVAEAFHAHPFGPLLYVLWTASAFACLYGYIKGKRFNTESKAANWALATLLFTFLGFGIYRFATRPYPASEWNETWSAAQTR
jgi:hypothetical protein